MGTSWYKDGWAPPSTAEATVEELTAFLLRELSQGAVASGIHPGIIGEVGAEDAASNPLSAAEHRRLIASTRAALLSGAPLSVHTWWDPGQAVNVPGIIEEQGLSPSRVMLSHAGAVAQDHALLRRLASAGYYLSFDTFAIPTHPLETSHDQAMLEAIVMLAREGLGERILVAQDVCTKVQMRSYGGHGYAFVLTDLVPRLRNLGLSAEQLQKILIDNPRRLLTFDPPRSPSW